MCIIKCCCTYRNTVSHWPFSFENLGLELIDGVGVARIFLLGKKFKSLLELGKVDFSPAFNKRINKYICKL
jgi:hypothetical protein